MSLPTLAPAMCLCLDCEAPRGLTTTGSCATCGSASVMREPNTARLFRRDRLDRPHVWPGEMYRPARWGRA